MMCKFAARNPLRRRKNYAYFVSVVLLCMLAWLRLAEFDNGYTPLRPLLDAESEARRLLAFIIHYNYQCNTTAGPIGNWTIWPVCVGREAGLNLDSKDTKLMYTIGGTSDFNLERTLALNHSFEVNIVTSQPVPRSLKYVNNTHVIPTTIVANDPADFSRNSFVQRTLNDLLAAQGHGATSIDLLRLVGTDSSAVSMSDLVHFLVADNVLQHVKQLHLTVYIDKLDEDYLYGWYRTLYRLFSKAGFHLFHTSSHDSLCLQVTLMQSCVYFLAYVRNPGILAHTMQPPADYGTVQQEWSRLQEYINMVQVDCKHSSDVIFSSTDAHSIADLLYTSCSENQPTSAGGSCLTAVFSSSQLMKRMTSSLSSRCSLLTLVASSYHSVSSELSIAQFKLASATDSAPQTVSGDFVINEFHRGDGPSSVIINVPRLEFNIINLLLTNNLLQNVTQLLVYVELPDINARIHPIVLRSFYSVLRRLNAAGLSLFLSRPITTCRDSNPRLDSTGFYRQDAGNSEKAHRCYWLGFTRSNFH